MAPTRRGPRDGVVTAGGADAVGWYENLGGQSFSTIRVSTSTLDYARALAVVDADGDGDDDVFAAGALADEIVLYENDGEGSFAAFSVNAAVERVAGVFSFPRRASRGDREHSPRTKTSLSRPREGENEFT